MFLAGDYFMVFSFQRIFFFNMLFVLAWWLTYEYVFGLGPYVGVRFIIYYLLWDPPR